MLELMGHKVLTAQSGKEALKLFKEDPGRFDLIIVDQTMPVMTGAALTREFLIINPGMRIIIQTGHSEIINEEKAKKIGAKALLMKPISKEKLQQTIRHILSENN